MLFDAHLHIIDLAFPLESNAGFRPEPFGIGDYRAEVEPLGISGGAVVSGSFQGFDQTYLLAALRRLGPGFVGVTQLPPATPDCVVLGLAEQGVRGIRFNIRRGVSGAVRDLEHFALRVYDLVGWHAEFYVDASDLGDLRGLILRLPAVSIDHLGLSARGLPVLLGLAERGVRVKACGSRRAVSAGWISRCRRRFVPFTRRIRTP